MIRKLIRDNTIINPIIRNFLRLLSPLSRSISWIAARYRIFGTVSLRIEGIDFKIFTLSDDPIANEIYYDQGYEASEFRLVKALTACSSFFIDVGANTGIFSLFAAKANPELKVMSFEPHPANFRRLKHNLAINGIKNVQGFQLALGDSVSSIEFTLPADESLSPTSSVNGAFASNFHQIPCKKISVSQTTLDKALAGHQLSHGDLLKIDVEYYELAVLKGAVSILSGAKPMILLEVLIYDRLIEQFPGMKGKLDEYHARDIQQFLSQFGYYPYAIGEKGVTGIESVLENNGQRNFLFVPRNRQGIFIPFESLSGWLP